MALLNVSNASGKLLALTNTGTAIAEVINQDAGDTDFESIREARAVWNLANISDISSSADTLVSKVPITAGDRLFLVKDNGSIFDFTAGAVTKSTIGMQPNMTSNTVPSGVVLGTGIQTAADAYKAFDGNSATYVQSNYNTAVAMQYQFANNERKYVDQVYLKMFNASGSSTTQIKILGSNDGINWVTISNYIGYSNTTLQNGTVINIQSPGEFSYYKLYTPNCNYMLFQEISFLINTGDSINTSAITQGEIPSRVFKFEDKIKFNGNVALEKDIYYEYGTAGSKLFAFPIYHDVILMGRTLETTVEFSAVGNELKEITGQIYKALV